MAADETFRDEVDEIVDQWREQRPDVSPDAIGVFGRITRINIAQRAILREVHERHGLTLAAFDVLANLRRSGAPHRKTAGELAESSLLTSGGITFRLDKMEADGLIRRTRSKEDRRVVYAELTELGLAKIDEVFAEHLATEQRMLGGLAEAEAALLTALLRKLGASVDASAQPVEG
ncbi:MarR family winged helix-turn-helix transcriptional regulator [Actinocorallia sp. A-T 12471]|uniref:MarR family winged helix-turn-helix transcriptional regulator n=1 Tax=Actinocorallia sp. A-T 12471 TaxID=3089813 RepID=UPI0029D05F61|nr:MarR family transcriptional regulator [Actinocorallia sp. A-T 12471]MDX6739587.1 MarR family transcriptional regulator [Actinocorallia sp. A-T 12471]